MKAGLFLAFFFCLSAAVMAQQKFSIEVTAGAASSFSKATSSVDGGNIPMQSNIGMNAGLSFLFPLSENWQLYSEVGFYPNALRNGVKTSKTDFGVYYPRPAQIPSVLPSFSLGTRYNFEVKNQPFFIQPGLVLSTSTSLGTANEFNNPAGSSLLEQTNKVAVAFRVDVGTKFMTKNDNYFVLGLRYQQGLTEMNRYTNPLIYDSSKVGTVTEVTRGSYLGVFAGYGFNSRNWKKSKR
ncbi:outer membrane beta-barrel protein [Algoriphagus resistens]|uniref:outer membrane beta-barrel protein n=1 Tax=Algoriphagus resistens TaxID=1750590 RepID=UPI000716A6A9|nr:outer membrane beta-barrel protein [Algoriphagus resistens]